MQELNCSYSCDDVRYLYYLQKETKYDNNIRIILISEAMPQNMDDYFDKPGKPQFLKNTNLIFNKLGYDYNTYEDYLKNGIYLTTALKCIKKEYLVKSKTLENCSFILEEELQRFKNTKAIMLMGDFAIKAVNYIWKRKFNKKIIPKGSIYILRKVKYEYNGIRFFPSYTQTGDSFGLEKSKLSMIEEDIKNVLDL